MIVFDSAYTFKINIFGFN